MKLKKLYLSFALFIWSAVLLTCAINPGLVQAEAGGQWWKYSYAGDVLPNQTHPNNWELVQPKVKSGMLIENKIRDGMLAMTHKGNDVQNYFQIWLDDIGAPVWRGDSEKGATVEFRVRVTEGIEKVPWTGAILLQGFGPQKNQTVGIYAGTNGVHLAGKDFPLDLTQFHIFRLTYDPDKKLFSFYIDGNATPAMTLPLDKVKPDAASSKILMGCTYGPLFQGTWEVAFIRWSNAGVFPPDGKTVEPPPAVAKPTAAPAKTETAKKTPPRAPIDLSDPDIARADKLLTSFERNPVLAVPLALTPPVVDGTVGKAEWANASQANGLIALDIVHLSPKPNHLFFQHDQDSVYLAFRLERPDKSAPKAMTSSQVNVLWNREDGVELVVSPDTGKHAIFSTYVNGASGFSCGYIIDGAGFDTLSKTGWTIKSRVTPQGIEGEVRIPKNDFAEILNAKKLTLDPGEWGFNAMRTDVMPFMAHADWSDMWSGADTYKGEFLGRLLLRPDPVAVRLGAMGALSDDQTGLRGEIVNPAGKPFRAKLTYAIYRANRNVREDKVNLYQTWDKVNRIRKTGSDVDEGAANQLFLGEDTWLKNLGKAYAIVKEGTLDLEVKGDGPTPFEIKLDQAGGQFIYACRLVKEEGHDTLWAQTVPVEVKAKLEVQVTKRFLTAKGVVVTLDASGSEKAQPEDKMKATLRNATDQKTIDSWEVPVGNKFAPVEKFVLMEKCPVGRYEVEASLVNGAGQVLGKNSIVFDKPAPPAWFNNKIGYSEEVPWPFTEVKAEKRGAVMWGRNYTWEKNNPFPSKIVTQGKELLNSPIELKLVSGGKEMAWKERKWKLSSATKRTAVFNTQQEAGDARLDLTVTVDFDGMMRFKGELQGQDFPVDSLQLRIPLQKEMVTHYYANQFETDLKLVSGKDQTEADEIGRLKQNIPTESTPFAALFWLGSDDGGIQWIAEWDKGWRNPDRKKVMQVVQGPGEVTLVVNMIGKSIKLKEAIPIDFALNVSPVKDMAYWWKMCTVANGSMALYPQFFDPAKARSDLEWVKKAGITHVMVGAVGMPFHADVWVRGSSRAHLKESIEILHEMGFKHYYYGCWGYDTNGKEAADFKADMMKVPLQPAGTDTYWYNPEGPWVDFYMAGLDNSIREFNTDGIYLDSMVGTSVCADPLVGQTFIDEEGNLHGKWPIFALRDWGHRMLNVMHITHRKDGIVYQHAGPNLAVCSLADARCWGEGLHSTESLKSSITLGRYYAEYSARPLGIPMETLWYNWWNRTLRVNQWLSVILLHGQTKIMDGGAYAPYALKPDYEKETTPNVRIVQLLREMDVPTCKWWPYYGKKHWITLEPSALYASAYLQRGKKALIVVSNLDEKPVNAKVTFDLKTAGFKDGAVKVTDAFLGTDIPVDGNTIALDIKDQRYRLLMLEAK